MAAPVFKDDNVAVWRGTRRDGTAFYTIRENSTQAEMTVNGSVFGVPLSGQEVAALYSGTNLTRLRSHEVFGESELVIFPRLTTAQERTVGDKTYTNRYLNLGVAECKRNELGNLYGYKVFTTDRNGKLQPIHALAFFDPKNVGESGEILRFSALQVYDMVVNRKTLEVNGWEIEATAPETKEKNGNEYLESNLVARRLGSSGDGTPADVGGHDPAPGHG